MIVTAGWLPLSSAKKKKNESAEIQRQIEQASYDIPRKSKYAKDNGFDSPEEMPEAAALVQEANKQGISLAELLADLTRNNSP